MNQSKSQVDSLTANERIASVSQRGGSITGICLYLSEEDLRSLGIAPVAVEKVEYSINPAEEQLKISPRDADRLEESTGQDQSPIE